MRYVVTGGAGFIGSNMVRGLNARGERDIVVVDNLGPAGKFGNLVELQISDYFHKDDFLPRLLRGELGKVEAIIHEGACSDTMEHDGRYMMENNYRWSKALLDYCKETRTRLLYASSAAVYGNSRSFTPVTPNEVPLNVYGYSKLLFDQAVRRAMGDMPSQVAGFRYFNVYGPGEGHKGRMASVAFHSCNQFAEDGHVTLFGAWDGHGAGEQSRDFLYIDDLVAVKLWFLDNAQASGIFNLGTGRAEPFNTVAKAVINAHRLYGGTGPLDLPQLIDRGLLRYVDFPEALKGKYQSFTCADITALREIGCDHAFAGVATGVGDYMRRIRPKPGGSAQ